MKQFITTLILMAFLCTLASCGQSSQTTMESNAVEIKNGYSVISIQPEYDLFDISLDSKNRIYYADKNKITIIDDNGKNLQVINDSLKFCTALAVKGDNIYTWDSADKSLKEYGTDGKLLKEYPLEVEKVKKLDVIDNIVVLLYKDKDNDNNSYMSLYNMEDNSSFDVESSRVISFTPYKDKKIIYCAFTDEGSMEFYELDMISKTSVKIYEASIFLYDICYNKEDDAVYYCVNEILYKLLLGDSTIKQVFSCESKVVFNRLCISDDSCFMLNSLESNIYMINIGNGNSEVDNTLTILTYNSNINNETKIKKATEAFKNSTTNTDITFESIEGIQYSQSLKTSLMANDSSFDIFLVGESEIDIMAKNHAILDLSPYKEIAEPLDSMFEGVLGKCTYNGILAGVPHTISFDSWGVNDDLLETLKLECPAESWTWYDFYDMAKKARKDINGDGVADTYIYQYPNCLLDWIRQYNCIYFNLLEGNANYDTDEFKMLMETSKKLKDENLISIGKSTGKKTDNILFYDRSFTLNSGNGHFICPPTLAGRRVYPANISLFCININSKKQIDAVKFLATYASREVQTVEPFSALYKDISQYNSTDEIGRKYDLSNSANYNLYENLMRYTLKQIGHPDLNSFQVSKINEFLDGKTSMEIAIDAIQERADAIVGE